MWVVALLANLVLTGPVTVVDGDTVRSAGVTYRLANIDAPETGGRARCDSEAALGAAATQRARGLVAEADVVAVVPTGRTDRYGRVVARVEVDGRDLGEVLMEEGLAQPWRGRRGQWC